jgi:hypothetical protein
MFPSTTAYLDFRRTYAEEVSGPLDDFREARRQSEEAAKQHWTV